MQATNLETAWPYQSYSGIVYNFAIFETKTVKTGYPQVAEIYSTVWDQA